MEFKPMEGKFLLDHFQIGMISGGLSQRTTLNMITSVTYYLELWDAVLSYNELDTL